MSKETKAEITPIKIVIRVLGVGYSAAQGVLNRLGDKAKDLPAQYAAGTARDYLVTHNVKQPKPEPKTDPKPEPIAKQ
jgi:hypothetical protein